MWVNFIGSQAETPTVIYRSWGNPLLGAAAVVNTFAIVALLVAMAVNAMAARRVSPRQP